jgi:hypothetical protein
VRAIGVFAGVFVAVLVVLLAGVGQLGKIDRQTLAVVLAVSAVAAGVVVWRTARRDH